MSSTDIDKRHHFLLFTYAAGRRGQSKPARRSWPNTSAILGKYFAQKWWPSNGLYRSQSFTPWRFFQFKITAQKDTWNMLAASCPVLRPMHKIFTVNISMLILSLYMPEHYPRFERRETTYHDCKVWRAQSGLHEPGGLEYAFPRPRNIKTSWESLGLASPHTCLTRTLRICLQSPWFLAMSFLHAYFAYLNRH